MRRKVDIDSRAKVRVRGPSSLHFFEFLTSSDVLILIQKAKLSFLYKTYFVIHLNKVE